MFGFVPERQKYLFGYLEGFEDFVVKIGTEGETLIYVSERL